MHSVEAPALSVPRCRYCGELVFNYSAEAQIREVLRIQLRLLTPDNIRAGRISLGLTPKELAERLGVAETILSRWEMGAQIQSRAMDNLLRVFFAIPEARSVLRGVNQDPQLGVALLPNRTDP